MFKIFLILFFPLILIAQPDENNFFKKYLVNIRNINLHVPDTCFFKQLVDLSFTKDKIYICVDSKYPVQVYDINGNFIKIIGRIGNGPTEYDFKPIRIAADEKSNSVALTDGPYQNTVYLITESSFLKKSDLKYKGTSDIEFVDGQILLIGSSSSEYHYNLLNQSLEIVKQNFIVPKESIILDLIRTPYWAIQKGKNYYLSNFCYPDIFLKSIFSSKEISIESKKNFMKSSTHYKYSGLDKIENDLKQTNFNIISEYNSISKINWLISNDRYLIGKFVNHNIKTNKPERYLFVYENDIGINEIEISKEFSKSLIPFNEELIVYDYINFIETSDVSLSIWQLKN